MRTLGRRNGDRAKWMELARLAWDVLEEDRQQGSAQKAGDEGKKPRRSGAGGGRPASVQ